MCVCVGVLITKAAACIAVASVRSLYCGGGVAGTPLMYALLDPADCDHIGYDITLCSSYVPVILNGAVPSLDSINTLVSVAGKLNVVAWLPPPPPTPPFAFIRGVFSSSLAVDGRVLRIKDTIASFARYLLC